MPIQSKVALAAEFCLKECSECASDSKFLDAEYLVGVSGSSEQVIFPWGSDRHRIRCAGGHRHVPVQRGPPVVHQFGPERADCVTLLRHFLVQRRRLDEAHVQHRRVHRYLDLIRLGSLRVACRRRHERSHGDKRGKHVMFAIVSAGHQPTARGRADAQHKDAREWFLLSPGHPLVGVGLICPREKGSRMIPVLTNTSLSCRTFFLIRF